MLAEIMQQEDRKHVLVLGRKKMKLLLKSINDLPKSAQQLATDCDIPLSTIYRMISELTGLNVIIIKRVLNKSGKWEKRYKCNEFLAERITSEGIINEQTNSESGHA